MRGECSYVFIVYFLLPFFLLNTDFFFLSLFFLSFLYSLCFFWEFFLTPRKDPNRTLLIPIFFEDNFLQNLAHPNRTLEWKVWNYITFHKKLKEWILIAYYIYACILSIFLSLIFQLSKCSLPLKRSQLLFHMSS